MNKSEIAERAAREIRRHFDEDFDTTIPSEVFDRDLVQIVERAIAESQAPQPDDITMDEAMGIAQGLADVAQGRIKPFSQIQQELAGASIRKDDGHTTDACNTRRQYEVYEEIDGVLATMELPESCEIRIEISDDAVILRVASRDFSWSRKTGELLGVGTAFVTPGWTEEELRNFAAKAAQSQPEPTEHLIRAMSTELGDGEPSPPPLPDECLQCGAPLEGGKCSVQPWHIVSEYVDQQTGLVWTTRDGITKSRSGAAQEVSPIHPVITVSHGAPPGIGPGPSASGTTSDPRTGYLKQQEVSPPSPEPEFIDFCESPCGHSSRYAFTENGGKNIECLLCNREAEGDTRELKAALLHTVGIIQSAHYHGFNGCAKCIEAKKLLR